MSVIPPEYYRYLGRLGKTYQLKGGLRFYSEFDNDLIGKLERIFIEGIGETEMRSANTVGYDLIIYLTYALNKETAQKLVNRKVYANRDDLPGETSLELIGLPVFLDGKAFGHVVDIQEGLQDLLIIEANNQEFLVPLEAPYVNIKESGVFLQNVPEGLLE